MAIDINIFQFSERESVKWRCDFGAVLHRVIRTVASEGASLLVSRALVDLRGVKPAFGLTLAWAYAIISKINHKQAATG